MSGELEPMTVLVGATLVSYCVWQLVFDPLRGPLPGATVTLTALVAGVAAGVALMAWGFYRLDVLRRP